jgi:peptide/nickel transport system ATP-binding protein
MTGDLLDIRGLDVRRRGAATPIVHDVDVEVSRNRVLGIDGETGAGKTLTVRAILGALPPGLVAATTSASVDGQATDDLTATMRSLRGRRIGVVVQDPLGALPPFQSVGRSLVTVLTTHRPMPRSQAVARIRQALLDVGLRDPALIMRSRPHELSGGMAQRVVIAAAFMTDPDLIVADEPTTALDPTVQAQILALLKREVLARNAGAVIITHDIGVVAQVCTDVMVLFGGTVREAGPVEQVLRSPQDDYTKELLAALPDAADHGAESDGPPPEHVVEMRDIVKSYGRRRPPVLQGVDLDVPAGRTLAIVGESGAGKSTLVRALLKLIPVDSGSIRFRGEDVTAASQGRFRRQRRDMQVVYQNPTAALNPRLTVRRLIEEPLLTFPEAAPTAADRAARVTELLAAVRLDPEMLDRYPTQLSGGQKQRVAIARALATRPAVVVLDEPTASLDLSVRRHIVDLLARLQAETGVAYVLVSHDFHTVRSLAHDVVVLYRGEVVEAGPTSTVLRTPSHEYTRTLLAAELSTVPGADAERLSHPADAVEEVDR